METTEQGSEMVYISNLNHKFEIPTVHNCTWKQSDKNVASPHTNEKWQKRDNSAYHENVLSVIGNTPLIKLNKIPEEEGVKCNIYAKCEFLNPGGSIKDRIAKRIVEDYEKQGILKPGMTLIEPTSGNTGIAIAMVSAVKGYKCILVMSEKSSPEKEAIIKSLGAEVVRTSVESPMEPGGPHDTAVKLKQEIQDSIILDQLSNPGNPLAHYDVTAEEILDQLGQKVDLLILPAGTGGTLTGVGRKFREKSPQTKIIGLDAEGSNLAYPPELNKTDVTFFEVEGIGFPTPISSLDQSVCDEWFKTNDYDSFTMARRIIREEGLLVGGSSGASLDAAIKLAKKFNLTGEHNVVIEFTDGIRNYMSKFLSDQWMEAKGFQPCKNTQNLWWWEEKISNLKLKFPLKVGSCETVERVMNILTQVKRKTALVVNTPGESVGTVNIQELNSRLLTGTLKLESTIEKCINKMTPKLEKSSTLGRAFRILEKDPCVMVVEKTNTRAVYLLEESDLLEYTFNFQNPEGLWSRLCCRSSKKY